MPLAVGALLSQTRSVNLGRGWQAQIASLMGELGPAEDLSLLEALEEEAPAKPAEPTMMSKEARALVMAGQGQAGLQLWKVGSAQLHPFPVFRGSRWRLQCRPGLKPARQSWLRGCSRV